MNLWRSGRVFIIAELGKNFIEAEEEKTVAEYLANAKELVRLAKEAGADAVKFQTHTVADEQLPLTVVSPHFKGADRYQWLVRNERATPVETFWKPLKAYCDEHGILFFSTPMSRASAQKLESVGVPLWKVGSGDILDFVCMDYLAATKKPIILSSGMSTLAELDQSVAFLRKRGADFALMHCVSKYPCPPNELQLATIAFLQERFGIPVGFSDHSIGVDSAVSAAALGARIIEKHFSKARDLWGADHKVSMTPAEFREMVQRIRALEADASLRSRIAPSDSTKAMLGERDKVPHEDEFVYRGYFRKSLMAARDLPAGHVLGSEDVYAMRPQALAGGLPSERYEDVLGRTLATARKKYEPITAAVVGLDA
jgi:sialic acid synthase SpsE